MASSSDREVRIRFDGSAEGLRRAAGQASSQLESVGDKFRRFNDIARVAALGVVGAFAIVGKQAIEAASDLEQSVGGVDAVFKENSASIKNWASDTTDNIRVPAAEVNNFAVLIGAQLKNAGVPMDALADKTKGLVQTGADLAAMYGGSTSDAVEALSAGLRGEFDSLDKYGLSINQTAIDSKVLEMGLDTSTVAAQKNAKATAYMALLAQQSGDAQGAAGRESSSYAAQMEAVREQVTNASAALGQVLMPVVKGFFDFLNGSVIPALQNNKGLFAGLAIVVGGLAVAVLLVNGAMMVYSAGAAVVRGAMMAWTGAQWLLNAAMSANPIGIVVVIIAALVAALIYAWNNSETFRNVVIAVWTAVKNFITAAVNQAISVISWFGRLPGLIGGWFGAAKDWAVRKLSELVAWVTGLPGRIMGAIGNIGSLLANSGRSLVDGFLGGIKGAWDRVVGFVRQGMQWVRDLFPFSPAKDGPFSGRGYVSYSGAAIAGDFAGSLREGLPGVISATRGLMSAAQMQLSPSITGGAAASLALPVSGGSSAPAQDANVYVTVKIGDQELKGLVQTQINKSDRDTKRAVLSR